MTFHLNFRSSPIAGSVTEPYMVRGESEDPTAIRAVSSSALGNLLDGKDLLFAVHGFNVRQKRAIESFAVLDRTLALGETSVLIGVLWPGDWWIPAVNYPFEGEDAMDCGRRLATYCTTHLAGARSISFLSHSLGARLVLEAVQHLPRRVSMVCLTAGAINRGCLEGGYATAARNIDRIYVLASHDDTVLKLAFPVGDPISNVLHDDHDFFERALGYNGPSGGSASLVREPWQIPDDYDFGHGSYLPSDDPRRWPRVAEYVRRAFLGLPPMLPKPFPRP
jgi:pimeloyl-ACP methyl ester carboxylesterase